MESDEFHVRELYFLFVWKFHTWHLYACNSVLKDHCEVVPVRLKFDQLWKFDVKQKS